MKVLGTWGFNGENLFSEGLIIVFSFFVSVFLLFLFINHLEADYYQLPPSVAVTDGFSFVSKKIYDENSRESLRPRAIIVGGSVARESTFQSSYDDITELGHYRLLNLAFSSQSLSQSLAILDSLQLMPQDIVFLQFSEKRFAQSVGALEKELLEQRVMGLEYRYISNHPALLHILTDWFFTSSTLLRFYSTTSCGLRYFWVTDRSLCFLEQDFSRTYYSEPVQAPQQKAIGFNKSLSVMYSVSSKDLLDVSEFVSGSLKRLQQKLDRIHLLEFPVDSTEMRLTKRYKKTIFDSSDLGRAIAEQNSSIFFHDNFKGFNDSDFYDSQHMIKSGKLKFVKKLELLLEGSIVDG